MENGGGIPEDARRPEVTPGEEVKGEVSSTPRYGIIDTENIPESKPEEKDSLDNDVFEDPMDGGDVIPSLQLLPPALPLQQQQQEEEGDEDSQGVVLDGDSNGSVSCEVLLEGKEFGRGEGDGVAPESSLEGLRDPDDERDAGGGFTVDKGNGGSDDDGLEINGLLREFDDKEISSAIFDDTEKKTNGSTGDVDDGTQITSSRRASEDLEISFTHVDNVKEREDNDGEQQVVGERNECSEGPDLNGASGIYNQEPENGFSAGIIPFEIATPIDSNGQRPPPGDKMVAPQNASVEVGILGSDSRSFYASGVSSERNDQNQPVAPLPELHEGESYHVPSSEQARKPQMKDEEEITGSDLKPEKGDGFQEEPVMVEDATESTSYDEDDSKTPAKRAATAGSSLKGSVGSATQSLPAGLGSSAPLLESAARSVQQPRVNGSVSQRQPQLSEDVANGDAEEYDETREKLQMIRVKFLRLAHRLGQTPHNVVVAQVLYRLGLAEQLRGSMNTSRAGAFSFDRASAMAEQLEAAGLEPLDFSCTIMVIGKTGVGKSATINSIFDKTVFRTDPFRPGTTKVQDIIGTVQGIKLRIIDTPGLSPSSSDQPKNERILHAVKCFIKKTPPDVIMYLDRLDMRNRDLGDVPLLRTITNVFGPSIWFNAIIVLTHAASAPPDGPNGTPLSYEMYVTQRSHVIQQAVRQAAGDTRLLNPVSLVENHSACRMNRAGQRVLPNGQVWKPHLMLLSFASKILTEANTLLKLQDSPVGRPFGAHSRAPPLPFFLSSLLQSRTPLKLPEEQFSIEDSLDVEIDEEFDSGEEYDYDELPPFKSLTKEQLNNLSKFQRKAYYDELDYREKLFYKKQMKEEKKHRKLLKKMAEAAKDLPDGYNNNKIEEESGGPDSVPVPMPDLSLPASFDSDYPSHRYRFLDSSNQWLVRPVLETQGWDHDVGYEGLNVEKLFVVKEQVPLSLSGQLTKDKKDCTLQMEIASSLKHGEGKTTSLGMDMQTVGKDMAYTFRGETQFNNFRRNSTSAGVSAILLGDTVSAGVKVEDKLLIKKRFKLLMAGGAMTGRGEVAYGGRVEVTLRDMDYPLGRALSTLALSVVDWHGDLAIGCNLQSQIPVGRHTNVTGHANLSNRGTGQVGIRINSTEQLQLALITLVPIFRNAKRFLFGSPESM